MVFSVPGALIDWFQMFDSLPAWPPVSVLATGLPAGVSLVLLDVVLSGGLTTTLLLFPCCRLAGALVTAVLPRLTTGAALLTKPRGVFTTLTGTLEVSTALGAPAVEMPLEGVVALSTAGALPVLPASHGCGLQVPYCTVPSAVSHALPPYAAGLMMLYADIIMPPPHEALQLLHSLLKTPTQSIGVLLSNVQGSGLHTLLFVDPAAYSHWRPPLLAGVTI